MFDNPDSINAAVRINADNAQNSPLHRAIYYSGYNFTGGGSKDLWIPVSSNNLITDTDTSDIVFGTGYVDVIEAINRKLNTPYPFSYLISNDITLHVAARSIEEQHQPYLKAHPIYDTTLILDPKDPSYQIFKGINEDTKLTLNPSMNRQTPWNYNERAKYKFQPLDHQYTNIPEFADLISEKASYAYTIFALYHGGPGFMRLMNPKLGLKFGYKGDKGNDNQKQIDFIDQYLPAIRDVTKSGKEVNSLTCTVDQLSNHNSYSVRIEQSNKFDHQSYCSEYGLIYDSKTGTIIYNPKKVKARITYYTKGRGNLTVKLQIEEKHLSKNKLYTILHSIGAVGNKLFQNIFIPEEGWDPKRVSQSGMDHLLTVRPGVSIQDAIKELSQTYYQQELYGITCYCDFKKLHKRYLKDKKLFELMKRAHTKFHKLTLGQILYYQKVVLGRNITANNYMDIWWIMKSVEAKKVIKLDIDEFHKDFAKSYSDYQQLIKEKELKKKEAEKRKAEKANRILKAAMDIANQKKEVVENAS